MDWFIIGGAVIATAYWFYKEWDKGRYQAGFPGKYLWTLPDGSPRIFEIRRGDDGSTCLATVSELMDGSICWKMVQPPPGQWYRFYEDEMLILGWREFPGA